MSQIKWNGPDSEGRLESDDWRWTITPDSERYEVRDSVEHSRTVVNNLDLAKAYCQGVFNEQIEQAKKGQSFGRNVLSRFF